MFQRQLSFSEAVNRALAVNYCNFSGRASRSEYWWFALFCIIASAVIGIVFSFSNTLEAIVSSIVSLALLLPGLGLSVRRLHDIGKSGVWILVGLIPIVGQIFLIIWYCTPSQTAPNEYGPVPNVQ
ncbi:MAG: DUF805 domain-containing protein [Clostridium sp.]|nr:DUF805 domain-containing protein [Prevotella sp.]MCM1428387.1 DUF805 domain-containing protein [Clostridium sp.]